MPRAVLGVRNAMFGGPGDRKVVVAEGGEVVALLRRLGDGGWYLETGVGTWAEGHSVFRSLSEATEWIASQLPDEGG
jgi:type IV secretory pathway TrbD component